MFYYRNEMFWWWWQKVKYFQKNSTNHSFCLYSQTFVNFWLVESAERAAVSDLTRFLKMPHLCKIFFLESDMNKDLIRKCQMMSVFMNSWYSINDIPRKTPPWGMNDLHVNTCLVDRKWIQEEKK